MEVENLVHLWSDIRNVHGVFLNLQLEVGGIFLFEQARPYSI